MKRKIITITILSMVTGLVVFNIGYNKTNVEDDPKNPIKNTNMLTMMLETEAGTGNYEEVKQSEWPGEGYIFNESLSRCENGGTLSWNNESKKVIMKSNISDKCYVYFDKYNTINITNVTASEITNNSITLNVSATAGNNPIETYYYSNNDGLSYETSSNNTYTFSGLEAGMEYNFIVYAIDSAGYKSNEYTLQVTTDAGVNFASYIINNVYTTDGTNGLYYHDGVGTYTNASQEAGDNSYRYSGADPNNYVCFGSDATECPNDNLYRIIGLFDDDQDGTYNIKLIKNLSIGNYFWDHDDISFSSINNISNHSNEYTISQMNNILAVPDPVFGANDWQTADINYYINNDLFWDSLDSNWQNIIMSTNWIAGGNSEENIMESPIKLAYQNEIINPTENVIYSDEIGLMYVSDYGYAASPENWQTNLSDYDNDINCNNNWLFVGLKEWTITPNPSASNNVFFVFSDGNLLDDYFNAGKSSVRPVFYLKSEVRISDGTGTSSDPYRLA